MNTQETLQQLMALRSMTERTGGLHEAQVLQLKIWPRVLFQSSAKSTFKVDVPKKKIFFEIVNGPAKKSDIKVRPQDAPPALDEWVKSLLGEDWAVTIVVKPQGKGHPKTYRFPGKKIRKESVEALCKRLAQEDRDGKE